MFKPFLSQINGYLNGFLGAVNFSANGTSGNVTSAITTVLSTAGKSGVSVPLQVASANQPGLITTSPNNRVEIVANGTGERLKDGSNNEVYGRLTEASGVYTLSYYTLSSGTETATNFSSATAIDFYFQYRFDLARLPEDFATTLQARIVSQDPRAAVVAATPQWFPEKLNVTAQNAVSALTKTPSNSSYVQLVVNGIVYNALSGASSAFTVSGKSIAWSTANAGFTLETTYDVVAFYPTLE